MRRKRLKTDTELEAAARIVRKDPVAVRSGGRIYSRDQIRKIEERIVPWYRGPRNGD